MLERKSGKLSLSIDNIIFCLENLKAWPKELFKLNNKLIKVAGSVNKKSAVFIYTTKNNPKIIKKTLSNYTSVKLENIFFCTISKRKKIWKKLTKDKVRLVHQKTVNIVEKNE